MADLEWPHKCPCKNEQPDPCPVCGATVSGDDPVKGVCQAGNPLGSEVATLRARIAALESEVAALHKAGVRGFVAGLIRAKEIVNSYDDWYPQQDQPDYRDDILTNVHNRIDDLCTAVCAKHRLIATDGRDPS